MNAARELQRAFDERFAAPAAPRARAEERLVTARTAGGRIAMPLLELAGIHARARLARVPGGAPGFVGIAALRGHVVPVFDLAVFLDGGARPEGPLLLAVTAARHDLALLVVGEIGYVELARRDVDAGGGGRHALGVARIAGVLVPIVSPTSIVGEIAATSGGAR